jgi:hypothetical protein
MNNERFTNIPEGVENRPVTKEEREVFIGQLNEVFHYAWMMGACDFEPSAYKEALEKLQKPSLTFNEARDTVRRFKQLMDTKMDYH